MPLSDTSPEAQAIQIEIYRAMSGEQRLILALEMSVFVRDLAKVRIRKEHPEWPGKGQLFVGTCFQPVDRLPEQIRHDIALMKQAWFTLVRVGDLSWEQARDHQQRIV